VWSVTSYQQLRNDALRCERYNRLHPEAEARVPFIEKTLSGVDGPFIAASDYMKALPDMLSRWLPGRLVSMGTEGYGMSDTREELRRHFEIDEQCITIGALDALRQEGQVSAAELSKAISELGVDPDKMDPLDL
jgi:pyruvate dehydrogenase E1 component